MRRLTIMIRAAAVTLAVAAVSATALTLTGSPASAALPYCNNISAVEDAASGHSRYPTYVTQAGATPTVNCDMARYNESGTTGQRKAIKQIQWDLNMCYGKSYVVIDGEYGPKTRQAVREVQSFLNQHHGAGLVVDGWSGPKTRKAMKHVAIEETFCVNTPNPVFHWDSWYWDLDIRF